MKYASGWLRIPLAELIDVGSGQVDPREAPWSGMPHIGGDNIESGTGRISGVDLASKLGLISGKYPFGPEDVLYSKIRPALNKVTCPDFEGICSADIYPLRPKAGRMSRQFLAHLLRSNEFLAYAEKHSTRTNIPKINREALLAYEPLVPPLHEQRRIADILDKADAIRRKRKEAITLTEELLRSAFLEMFGDPVRNEKGWPVKSLAECLTTPLRNGLSPASIGNHACRVLTLSAITRGTWDPSAVKDAHFAVVPPDDVRICSQDFLICRGNGNLELVGSAQFPQQDDANVVFPDTMIAARINAQILAPDYLTMLWRLPFVRTQLESSARTTNGTFKVNQTAIENVRVLSPPLTMQKRFGDVAKIVTRLQDRFNDVHANHLFSSLVDRAFRGELTSPSTSSSPKRKQLGLFGD